VNNVVAQLLWWIKKDPSVSIVAIIRHSIRGKPVNQDSYYDIPLLPIGRKKAFEFGMNLPNTRPIRIFYSPVPRCKETATCIEEGVSSNHGLATLMGKRDFLGPEFMLNPNKMIRMIREMGLLEFARKWLDEEVSKQIMYSPHIVVSNILNGVVESLGEYNKSEPVVDVHVAHDWNVLCLRAMLLKVRHEEVGWPKYLDGVILTQHEDEITLRWKEYKKTINKKAE